MAGLVAGLVARNFCGRSLILNTKCVNHCFPRFLSVPKQDEKPKKPAIHFLLYFKNIKSSLDKKNPDAKITEKVKLASEMYKDLSLEEKQKLTEQSEKLLQEYKDKLKKWQSSLSSEEKEKRLAEFREKREKKEKRKIAKLQRENEMPRRLGTSFTLYVSDQLNAINLQFMAPQERLEAVRKNMSDCSKRWKEMPEAEKEIYNQRAAEEQELHEVEMLQWEQNMIEEGKENLVRKQTLKKHQVATRKAEREAAKAEKEAAKAEKEAAKAEKEAAKTSEAAKKTVSKKSGVKSTEAVKSKKAEKSSPKKQVRFEESKGKEDFYSSDSE